MRVGLVRVVRGWEWVYGSRYVKGDRWCLHIQYCALKQAYLNDIKCSKIYLVHGTAVDALRRGLVTEAVFFYPSNKMPVTYGRTEEIIVLLYCIIFKFVSFF